jgi:serine protease Do
MLRKLGDGILTILVIMMVIGGILGNLGSDEPRLDEAMPPLEETAPAPRGFGEEASSDPAAQQESGRTLPAPSDFDPRSLVEASPARNWSSGTAFAIGSGGLWMTAKHVANGCDRLGIMNENGRVAVKAQPIYFSDNADVALFRTEGGPQALALDLDETDLKLGSKAFHVGYPQGKPGEVTSRLIGRELMITEGAWEGKEQTLSWAETGRSAGLNGSLGGLSGGPAFDSRGNVIGITIAESPRRGRIVTTSSASLIKALRDTGISPRGTPQGNLAAGGYSAAGNRLRESLKVVQVICLVGR